MTLAGLVVRVVPTLPEAVDQVLAGPPEAIDEARILVLAIQTPANIVAAVDVVTDSLTLALEAVPATLANRAGRPHLRVAIGGKQARVDAIAAAAALIFALRRVAGPVAAGIVVADLHAGIRLAIPTTLAAHIPCVAIGAVRRGFATFVAVFRAALDGLATGRFACAVATGFRLAHVGASPAHAREMTAAVLPPIPNAIVDGLTLILVAHCGASAVGTLPVAVDSVAVAATPRP